MNFLKKNFIQIGSGISLSLGTYYYYKRIPQYTYKEVRESNKILTTYENNVYDITKFVESHPGGKEKIMLAANKQLEPYWNLYKQHFKPEVFELLDSMKVGELSDYNPDKFNYLQDPYQNEPERSPKLKIHSQEPCNAETPKELIHKNHITPNELWFIRNHHPVPLIKPEDYRLNFYFKNKLYKTLNLEEIKAMPSKKIITTIQCGGNRRGEFEGTVGTQWDIGAISTAEWEGVLLHDLLQHRAKHIHFVGYDGVKVSIPFKKGTNALGDVILAYKMNGEDLPRDHGFPVRVIVPGYVGIRNIKWIEEIILEDEEAQSPWQSGLAYKVLPGSIRCLEDVSKVDLSKIDTINELPIQSCITFIEKLDKEGSMGENYRVNGYAYTTNQFKFPKIDVSVDGGKTWYMAGVNTTYKEFEKLKWSWCLWSVNVKVEEYPCEVRCRAIDDKGNIQPDEIKDIWNIRGLSNNSVHKINID